MSRQNLHKILKTGVIEAGLEVTEAMQEKLLDYVEILQKWNAIHNLTSVRDPEEMITRHILDSLVLLPYVAQQKVTSLLDVGTGAGLPGIPLAIVWPDCQFVLLDSQQKKISFVQHVILSLKLPHVVAVCARVEAHSPTKQFDWVVSRAFASLSDFIRLAGHLCKPEGKLVAMKAELLESKELGDIPTGCHIEQVSVVVPGTEVKRSLVFIEPPSSDKEKTLC